MKTGEAFPSSTRADAVLSSVQEIIERLGWLDEGERVYLSEQRGRFARMLDLLGTEAPAGATLLDVGSHALHFSMAARLMGFDVWGADIERFATDPVLERRQTHVGIREIRTCDLAAHRLPYDDDQFDILVFGEALEHLNFNPLPVVKEMHRVVKPGGICLLTTPNAARLGSRLRLLAGRSVFADLRTLCLGDALSVHFREYTLDEVRQVLEWAGFHIVRGDCCYLYPSSGYRKLAKAVVQGIMPSIAGNLLVVGRKGAPRSNDRPAATSAGDSRRADR